MQKIKFIPLNKYAEELIHPPIPSKSIVPTWYKNMEKQIHNKGHFVPKCPLSEGTPDEKNLTVKTCIPFLDTFTSGYMITLSCDVWAVDPKEYNHRIMWDVTDFTPISTHSKKQIDSSVVPEGFEQKPFKWENNWIIKTPPGYSCLFVHPMQRLDLPFITISGIVDTDSYGLGVNFPFFLKENYHGLIEKGTPICQVIPFKRDEWQSEICKYEDTKKDVETFWKKFKTRMFGYYQKENWTMKKYF